MNPAEKIQKNVRECFLQFQKEQFDKTKQEIFGNAWHIAFYIELHMFLTENDLNKAFSEDELSKLAAIKGNLIELLYDYYNSHEFCDFNTWGDISEFILLFLKEES